MNIWILLLAGIAVIVNIVSFLLYAWDKCTAVFGRRRVPEQHLIATAFAGPFGAYAGMLLFRHKIRNPRFSIIPVWLVVQAVAMVALFIVYRPLS